MEVAWEKSLIGFDFCEQLLSQLAGFSRSFAPLSLRLHSFFRPNTWKEGGNEKIANAASGSRKLPWNERILREKLRDQSPLTVQRNGVYRWHFASWNPAPGQPSTIGCAPSLSLVKIQTPRISVLLFFWAVTARRKRRAFLSRGEQSSFTFLTLFLARESLPRIRQKTNNESAITRVTDRNSRDVTRTPRKKQMVLETIKE